MQRCINCRYELSEGPAPTVCPECGVTAVTRAAELSLASSGRRWRQAVQRGLLALSAAAVASLIIEWLEAEHEGTATMVGRVGVAGALLAGAWLISRLDPMLAQSRRHNRRRHAMRIVAGTCFLAWLTIGVGWVLNVSAPASVPLAFHTAAHALTDVVLVLALIQALALAARAKSVMLRVGGWIAAGLTAAHFMIWLALRAVLILLRYAETAPFDAYELLGMETWDIHAFLQGVEPAALVASYSAAAAVCALTGAVLSMSARPRFLGRNAD